MNEAERFRVADRRQRQFSQVPLHLLRSTVSDRAVRLYATMDAEWINRKLDDPTCWPSQELLASMLRTSVRSIERAIAELVAIGAIEVHRVKSGPWPHNVYVYIDRIPEQPDRSVGYPASDPPLLSKAPDTGDGLSRIIDPEEEKPAPSATGSQDAPQRMIDRPATERFDTSLPSYKLCAYFAAKWLEHTPDAKPNITKKWVDEADRLLRIDQRDKAEIKEIIDWMFTNHERPYYGNSCHAIPSFRKLYLKIRGEMWTAQKRTGGGAPQSRPRGVQQQPQSAPVQFGTDGKVTEAYVAWEHENLRTIKADMIDEIGEAGIEVARAAGRLPAWWDEVES